MRKLEYEVFLANEPDFTRSLLQKRPMSVGIFCNRVTWFIAIYMLVSAKSRLLVCKSLFCLHILPTQVWFFLNLDRASFLEGWPAIIVATLQHKLWCCNHNITHTQTHVRAHACEHTRAHIPTLTQSLSVAVCLSLLFSSKNNLSVTD